MELTIGAKHKGPATQSLIEALEPLEYGQGYVGYPIVASADGTATIDAVIIAEQCGLVIFDILEDAPRTDEAWSAREQHQTELFTAMSSQLMLHKDLVQNRRLATEPVILTFSSTRMNVPEHCSEIRLVTAHDLRSVLASLRSIDARLVRPLTGALQHVSTIKPRRKRETVKKANSRGSILKELERQIANLDRWQKKGAIENPEGPQRIRGLAGSGKTIVLALKAAYLHSQHPSWNIAVTYYTRSLRPQFQDLIRRFTFEHLRDEPDWERVRVVHSWGSPRAAGMYSTIATHYGIAPLTWSEARNKFGRTKAFDGACQELLEVMKSAPREPIFDAILIDEAQDLPKAFFEMVFLSTRSPHRIVWAYDELQNIGGYSMTSPEELFGKDFAGEPRVSLHNDAGRAQQDIILPVCYRNTPWALSLALGLGIGVTRKAGQVQNFDDPKIWDEIGYEVVDGTLAPGRSVTLKRSRTAIAAFHEQLLTAKDAVTVEKYADIADQATKVASAIAQNLAVDELEHEDILVIIPNAIASEEEAAPLIEALASRGIPAHIAGTTEGGPDGFQKPGSVTISSIFRAKGNEAPMVYVLSAEYCVVEWEQSTRRNILFTSITRSRAWVRLCGCGPGMDALAEECASIAANDFALSFIVPTEEDLAKMRRLHRDRRPNERKLVEQANEELQRLTSLIASGEVDADDLDANLIDQITRMRAQPK